MKIFTLKNCDTCKKALKWLDTKGASYENHDVRADGLTKEQVTPLVEALGWETAINRRSTTWRGLGDVDKDNIDNSKAVDLIVANPTLMKRPIYVSGDDTIAGFDAKAQSAVEAMIGG